MYKSYSLHLNVYQSLFATISNCATDIVSSKPWSMFRCPETGTVQSNRQDDNSPLPELKKEAEETSFHEVSCATGDIRVVDHCHLSTRPLKWETIALHFAESISISLLYKNLNYTNRNGYFNLWLNAKNYYPRKLQKSIPHSILNLAWCKLYVFITKFRCSFLHPRDLTQQNHGIRY